MAELSFRLTGDNQYHFHRDWLSVLCRWTELPLLQRMQQETRLSESGWEGDGKLLEMTRHTDRSVNQDRICIWVRSDARPDDVVWPRSGRLTGIPSLARHGVLENPILAQTHV